jgi:hypothetical protein
MVEESALERLGRRQMGTSAKITLRNRIWYAGHPNRVNELRTEQTYPV